MGWGLAKKGMVDSLEKEKLKKEYDKCIEFCEKYGYSNVEELKEERSELDEPLKIMIVGIGNSGKSTLLNALVGVDVAEVDFRPKTWCINLYQKTKGDQYAELVYEGNIRERTTIESAKKLLERIAKKDYPDKEPVEIRWYYPELQWPTEDVFLVDTQGFAQMRDNLPEAEKSILQKEPGGFMVNVSDSFRKYYFKADLVLWCLDYKRAKDDPDVNGYLQEAKEISSDVEIIGIITKLDKKKDPTERQKVFEVNDTYFNSKYGLECIKSGLGRISPKDDPGIQFMKTNLRNVTVDNIRSRINLFLQMQRKKSTQIKLVKAKTFLVNDRKVFGRVFGEKLKFYCDNYKLYIDIFTEYNGVVSQLSCSSQQDIRASMDRLISRMKRDSYIGEYWQLSNGDIDKFKGKINSALEEGLKECEKYILDYREKMHELTKLHIEGVKWKKTVVSIGGHNDVADQELITAQLGNIRLPKVSMQFDLNIDTSSVLDDIADVVASFFSSYLAQEYIRGAAKRLKSTVKSFGLMADEDQRRLEEVERNIAYFLQGKRGECENIIDEYRSRFFDVFNECVSDSFKNHTGVDHDAAPDKVYELEADMIKAGISVGEDLQLYPEVIDGKLRFTPSCYKGIFQQDKPMEEEVLLFEKGYIIPAAEKVYNKKRLGWGLLFKKYNGTKGINLPSINKKDVENEIILGLKADISGYEKINWRGKAHFVAEKISRNSREVCHRLKYEVEEKTDEAEERLLGTISEQFYKSVENSWRPFYDSWKYQLECDYQTCIAQGRYNSTSPFINYVFYYTKHYSRYVRVDNFLYTLIHYNEKQFILTEYIDYYTYYGVDGRLMKDEIHRCWQSVYERVLEKFDATEDEYKQKWEQRQK